MSIFFAAPIEQFPNFLATSNLPTGQNWSATSPVTNLATYDPTQTAQTSGVAATEITWDFGQIRDWDMVSLLHTNLPYTATWHIQKSDNGTAWTQVLATNAAWANFGNGAVPSGPFTELTDPRRDALRRPHTLWHGAVQSSRYVRVTIPWPGQAFSVGRLFIGRKFTPSTGWQYGSQFNFLDLSKRERTDRGALVLDPLDPVVAAAVKMEFLNKQEMYDFVFEFNYWRGGGREFFACLDVEDIERLQKNILYCTIAEGRQISHDAFNTHSQTWILESIA